MITLLWNGVAALAILVITSARIIQWLLCSRFHFLNSPFYGLCPRFYVMLSMTNVLDSMFHVIFSFFFNLLRFVFYILRSMFYVLDSTFCSRPFYPTLFYVLGSGFLASNSCCCLHHWLVRYAEMYPAPFQSIPIFCPRIPDICGRGHGQLVVSGLVVFL